MDNTEKENKGYQDSIELQIIQCIDRIRPFIQSDGGDLRLVSFEDGIVYIKLYGACVGCMSVDTTIQDGIEAILKDEIPEVVKVVNVDATEIMEEENTKQEDNNGEKGNE